MKATAEISPGTLIDRRYRVRQVLGEGGMGRTYLVADERCFDDLCVLKEFLPPQMDAALLKKSRELFEREARVLHQLSHPQIPRFLACFEEEGRLFLAEEYIEGQNYHVLLEERLANQGLAFSEAEILQWLEDLLPVLDYIHRCQVIHRDISPDNIMLPRGDRGVRIAERAKPILIDFGVVKQAMTEVGVQSSGNRTSSTAFVGKVGYSPPEQMRMGQCYPSSDLYSLAVTALVLLTGKPPSELYDSYGMQWQWRDRVRISDALAQILTKMLAERPQDRYQSAAEAMAALSSLAQMRHSLAVVPRSKSPAIAKVPSTRRDRTLPTRWTAIASLFSLLPEANPSKLNAYTGLAVSLSGLAAIIFASIIIGMRSPYISFLCKPLNSCARDEEFQQFYARVLQQETTSRLLSRPPQNLEDLQKVRDRLYETLAQLRSIPEDVKIHSEAQPLVAYYRNELQQIDARIVSEKMAAEQLATVEKLAQKAARATSMATTKWRLEDARAAWEKVLAQLNQIPAQTFVSDRVKAKRSEYRDKISGIEEQLEQLAVKRKQPPSE